MRLVSLKMKIVLFFHILVVKPKVVKGVRPIYIYICIYKTVLSTSDTLLDIFTVRFCLELCQCLSNNHTTGGLSIELPVIRLSICISSANSDIIEYVITMTSECLFIIQLSVIYYLPVKSKSVESMDIYMHRTPHHHHFFNLCVQVERYKVRR